MRKDFFQGCYYGAAMLLLWGVFVVMEKVEQLIPNKFFEEKN